MERFREAVNTRHQLSLQDYAALYDWSVLHAATFWESFADFSEIQFHTPARAVREVGATMREDRWFPEATLSYAEHLLRRRDATDAIIAIAEDGSREALTFAQLAEHVAGLQRSLRDAGVGRGDRVAAYLPNTWQTIVGLLATSSLGAIWSSCSPDFGVQGVLDRFGQIAPKVLIASTGYRYNGKVIDLHERLGALLPQLSSVEQVILVPYAAEAQPQRFSTNAKVTTWEQFYEATGTPEFTPVPFHHPLYILYSSGTTGAPKCIVHGTGGPLLQHLKELRLHIDLTENDTLSYYTTCGWMMWNWMVTALALGTTLVLYEGSPFYPAPERLPNVLEAERVTVFGTSAKYLAALEKAEVRPAHSHDLQPLKAICSTGSPLSPESYEYVYRDFKADVCLASISGGTDIVSCFATGNPTLPVYAGELQCVGLGLAVEIWNEAGERVIGEKGELVCTQSFPCLPVQFWNDPDGARYRAAYFEHFPDVWAHGDYAEETERGGLIIYGRSDAVLNPGGVRIGTAEIYRQVEKIEEVLEALAIGQEWDGDVRVVLFVRLRAGVTLDEALEQRIRTEIRTHTTPRHVPARVVAVADIPRTVSGKIVELAVRNVVHGRPVKNVEALANPQALDLFRDLEALRS
jgi:acetoacetyl-CoA synthetase